MNPRALAARLPAALAVLRGRRAAAPLPHAEAEPTVSTAELRALLDLAAFGHGLDPRWLRETTSDGLAGVEGVAQLERVYRARRWATVEAGDWPEPEKPWIP